MTITSPKSDDEAALSEFLEKLIDQVWNEPDPSVVRLRDGRKVARKYYDPALHGEPVDD